MKKIVLISGLLLLALLQFGCNKGTANHSENETVAAADSTADSTAVTDSAAADKKDEAEEDDRIPVEVMSISSGEISDYLLLSSNLETEKMADVYSRVQGLVKNIKVEEGDFVKKGQALVTLEADEYVIAERKAFVNYEQERNIFERAKVMLEKKLLSIEEFEQAKYKMQAQKLAWDEAKLNLDYTVVTAPISGVVGDRLCRTGDRIQTSDKLFSIINTDEMIAVVYVPEKEIQNVRKGQSGFVMSNHIGGQQFRGWVKRVSPVVDAQSGTFKVTVGVKNPGQQQLRPGMFVNVHIVTNVHQNAVLIPKMAIVYENEDMNVFVVRDSIAHKIMLEPGFQDYEFVESLKNIAVGEKIIIVGQSGLKDQSKVKVVSERQRS